MPRRLNPPPNWPQELAHADLPPDWQPDPAWGPPPEGWQLWTDEAAPPAGTPNDQSTADAPRPWYRKKRYLIPAGLIAVIAIGASLSGGGDDTDNPADAAAQSVPAATSTTAGSATSAPAASSTSAAPASTTPKPTPTTPDVTSTTPPPTVAPPADPVMYSGSGDSILQIAKPAGLTGAVLVSLTHSGASNFAVWALDDDLQETDLLANVIGAYDGTVLLDKDGGETSRLEITADGAWTVAVRDVRSATQLPAAGLSGSGPDVVLWLGQSAGTATFSHQGESNFAVWFYGESTELLVNEFGAYEGTTRLPAGPAFLQIEADGAWQVVPGS
jgi:hypothetical protein